MVVWVLIITMNIGCGMESASCPRAAAVTVVDNIASAESCEQLARVMRAQRGIDLATCAPVRKAVLK